MNRIIITIISLLSLAIAALPAYAESTRKERRLISEGNRLYKEGKFKEASKQYQMAVAVNPQSPEARFNLALSHLKLAAQPGVDEKQREKRNGRDVRNRRSRSIQSKTRVICCLQPRQCGFQCATVSGSNTMLQAGTPIQSGR